MTIKTLGSVSIVKNDQTTRRAGRLSGEKTVRTGVLCAVSQGHLFLPRLYRKKCPGEGGYFAQTFSELVRQRLCLHSRARAARSLVVPALSGCERSGRACSQAARNLVMLAFPSYKGSGRTCPPKNIGPGRACPHGSRKFVALALQVARDLRPERNRAFSAYSPFPFRTIGRLSLPILIDGVRMYASSVILLNVLFCAGVLFCNLDSARFRLRHGQALCMPVRISLPTSS